MFSRDEISARYAQIETLTPVENLHINWCTFRLKDNGISSEVTVFDCNKKNFPKKKWAYSQKKITLIFAPSEKLKATFALELLWEISEFCCLLQRSTWVIGRGEKRFQNLYFKMF